MAEYLARSSGGKGCGGGAAEAGGSPAGPIRYIIIMRACRCPPSSPPKGERSAVKGSMPGIPPGMPEGPKGEGKGSSPSWDELSRNPLANGFDSIFSLVICKEGAVRN